MAAEKSIGDNLKRLRKEKKLSQEELAEKLGVSRQAVAKWEKNETVPDLTNCIAMADLYDVSIDTMVRTVKDECKREHYSSNGKHIFGMVRVNEKGQITIQKKCREIFNIKPGDLLIVLGDEEQGIALVKSGFFFELDNLALFPREEEN